MRTDYEILSGHFTCKRVKIRYRTPEGEIKGISTKFQKSATMKEFVKDGMDICRAHVRDYEEGKNEETKVYSPNL